MQPVDVDEIRALGRARGLDAVGVARATPMLRARAALLARRAAGLHDGMQFTYKNPERSTDPGRAVTGAQAVIVGARNYLLAPPERPTGPVARVARYAWTDHYAPLRAALWDIAHHLRRAGWKAVVFADDNTIVDREAAYEAGIGWFGKNANVLLPGAGSWYVLGCVVTDAPLAASTTQVADGCGPCRRCLDACPTGAIVAPGVVDARRCLAWLVQRPGVFPTEHRAALGDRIYGCDDCQEVCPVNRHAAPAGGPVDGVAAWVPVLELLAASDEELLARHGRWYLHDRQPRWLRRNALVVLGNVGDGADPAVCAALVRCLADPDPIVRAHAVWAAFRLGRADLVDPDDPDPLVRAETAARPNPEAAPL
jgi:epoxyqueuosine reductase